MSLSVSESHFDESTVRAGARVKKSVAQPTRAREAGRAVVEVESTGKAKIGEGRGLRDPA